MTQNENNTNSNETPSPSEVTQENGDTGALIEKLRAEIEQAKSENLYTRADFDNYKRNAIKERSELLKYGSERVLNEVLQVMDNFERALQIELTEKNFESFKKGVEMIAVELRTALQKFGLKEVPSEGLAFDPTIHEALSSEETDSIPAGHISRVFRKAYKLHDKVIRTGQVVVAKEISPKN